MRECLLMYKEIIRDEMPRLRELNAKCMEAERRIMDMALELDRELKAKVNDANSVVEDYELDAEVYFYHTSDDEKYDDPIAQCNYYLSNCSKEGKYQMLGSGENWNDHAHREGHPLFGEHFCYMFHDLTHYNRKYPPRKHNGDVALEELLLIDSIWVDVIPKIQTWIEFPKATKTQHKSE